MVVELEPGLAYVQQAAFPLRHDVMGVKSGTEPGSDPLADGVNLVTPGRHDLGVEVVQELAIDRSVLVMNGWVSLADRARSHVDCDTGGSDGHSPERDVIRPALVMMDRIDVAGVIARGVERAGAMKVDRPIRSHDFIGEHGYHPRFLRDELRHPNTRWD